MKLLLTFISLHLISLTTVAGGFHFPGEEYAYAKVYYFNLEEIRSMPDFDIYTEEEGWAPSLIDPDIKSEHGLAENMEKLFLYGADGLITGLSKCFIPRHGLVYFDENDEPVASLSICFECQGISMWTKSKGRIEPTTTGSVKRAENQIGTLRKFMEKEGVIVSDNLNDYGALLTQKGASITLELYQLDQSIVDVTYREVIQWNESNTFIEDVNIEYSAGGEKYEFAELSIEGGTHILFDGPETDAKMVEATIMSPDIKLPNGVHIGSSYADVLSTIDIYDGPSAPEIIEVKDHNNSIRYHFSRGAVKQINIECYFH
ncbi:hypothetical protein [Parvicella tangerina]|uniref:Uncharacterized protein n=1 Tax=Parvicella tangerina TaxID=2829795 RepID=A0A916JRT4_9FLAO|nr:hypothetical protein [Parvicella tangerina]CAG5086313.1 hypothetical protein CRYO30217_03079 [Parvicella tangerina]